ncbi:MAG: D-alanyl-D-alanine carboxypeptidase [Candidatus Daviesbacteria bacterium GW2011_GWA2_38_24]|uniref:D-alanyl-D-alanine carboxypeptidase n=1 Tax=Candidatus Daviesbacteria bacterium GW2011_GWA2_38_24 TaxID=1618422 RepID=A0A0G0M132_9BACT|nr:MAG: D-alanyl-D-alanine carboxypeptidase [Candidatus Daviesbacteria bacterium GW2011_GWA2_38_24]KKQ78635.1 MAG: D-alanyl-D-alanine carboxypeptidase [Candidatus Daviesbacteria bacterium GW2011_GWA1_38_7]
MKKLIKSLSSLQVRVLTAIYLLVLFSAAIGSLIFLPKIISVTESSFLVSSNSKGFNSSQVTEKSETKKSVTTIKSKDLPLPSFTASAVLAKDLQTGEILYEKNIHNKLAPASTTKIMTALVAVEYFKPADVLIVYSEALVGGSTMGLNVGEQLSFRSLLYGMMLNSGNDAAFTIASNFPGGVEGFVSQMNKKVQDLKLRSTHFDNPAGFDSSNHFSSAADLSVISEEVIRNYQLARVVATKETSVSAWDKSTSHTLKNLNKLLAEEGMLGIKTGFTEKAGESFVGLVERNGRKVLTVVLNSNDRFKETKDLIDWVYKNYSWQEVYQ